MDVEVKRWIIGLLFALVVGGIVVPLFLYFVRRMLGLGEKPKRAHGASRKRPKYCEARN